VKPGAPFSIVLNKETKRKTEAVVGFEGSDRYFGSEAMNLMGRKPETTYAYLKQISGRAANHSAVAQVAAHRYPFSIKSDEARGSVRMVAADGNEHPAEELVAMILEHVKEMARIHGEGAKIRDCVITVPSYFTMFERQALMDAAEIAGLKVRDGERERVCVCACLGGGGYRGGTAGGQTGAAAAVKSGSGGSDSNMQQSSGSRASLAHHTTHVRIRQLNPTLPPPPLLPLSSPLPPSRSSCCVSPSRCVPP
jgi:hypothetical protein